MPLPTGKNNDIAVIGFAFKLPQDVNDVDDFWEVLQNRKNLMTPWPDNRMNAESFVSGEKSKKAAKFNCRGGYFIKDDPAVFDAPFFSISTKEAAAIDPMQRWTLETSYRAFENAGIPVSKLRGSRTGVFSASFTDDWSRMISQDPDNVERMAATGTASSLISNRLSWYLDLRGPSVHIDTACSSSLFAVDMACQSLRAGETSTALVTGSSLILTPTFTHFLSNLGFLSPDSKCWAFDDRANGYARGEGFVAILLKPVAEALRDGDMIRAVIRGSGSNQDGQTSSLTQPSPRAQEELIRHVYRKAGLSFDKTRYVEAHGTGTPVGDPIEAKAIGSVFRNHRSAEEPIYIGSVKTNIGHLEGSSGLAGVIKSIISLEKGVIPPHALFEKINPDIDAEFYNLAIPTRPIDWPSSGLRRISVNSFGFGGTNTHVILDDAYHYIRERGFAGNHCTQTPAGVALNGLHSTSVRDDFTEVTANGASIDKAARGINGHSSRKIRLLVWSAADEKALQRTLQLHHLFWDNSVAVDSGRIDRYTYTLSESQSRMLWRASAIVKADNGANHDSTKAISKAQPVRSGGSGDVFTDQGAQYAGMGWDLLHNYPVFAEALERVRKIYTALGCDWNLLDELQSASNIDFPEYSQTLSTAVQIALIELLRSFGITPKVVVGHSSGEIAAAYAAGALTLESACKVSYFRGKLAGHRCRSLSSCPSAGAMISVNLAEHEVPNYLEKAGVAGVGVACVNSPLNCTLSGPEKAIDAISSPIPMVSAVTGEVVRPAVLATAQYWVDNMVSPVRFADALGALTSQSSSWKMGFRGNITDVVEIGPTAALRRPVADTLAKAGPRAKNMRYSSVLYRNRSAVETMLDGGFLVDCPQYPFGHSKEYWAESRISRDYRLRGAVKGETLGFRASDWNPLAPRWRNFLSVESMPWLADHNISNTVVFPAAGMLVMAVEAALQMVPLNRTIAGFSVKDAYFKNRIVVGETSEDRTETVVELTPLQKSYEKSSTWSDVRIFIYRNKECSECFQAQIQVEYQEDLALPGVQKEKDLLDRETLRRYEEAAEGCTRPVDLQVFYRKAAEHGLRYGDRFQLLDDIHWDGQKNAVARIDVSKPRFNTNSLVHPAVLDTVFHMIRASSQAFASAAATNVPVKVVNAWFSATGWQSPETGFLRCWGVSNVDQDAGEDGTIYALADNGKVLMSIEHITTVAVSRTDGSSSATKKLLHRAHWKPQLSLLSSQRLSAVCVPNRVMKDEATAIAHHAEMASVMNLALSRTLRQMTTENYAKIPASLARHMDWVKHHVNKLSSEQKDSPEAPPEAPLTDHGLELRLQRIEEIHPAWKLHTDVVRELKNILVGEKDPLEVIFNSDLADVFYCGMIRALLSLEQETGAPKLA
ncbi:polyketide synthase [Colletotrichum musicola]|uniref:Polyketide synthase n=1 Tax=Colletotrichum musicola TaxID=2175873 RepID=A0A8H6J689_9PEZI|nr:polyketide synthase [Colletotrichum musicola]